MVRNSVLDKLFSLPLPKISNLILLILELVSEFDIKIPFTSSFSLKVFSETSDSLEKDK